MDEIVRLTSGVNREDASTPTLEALARRTTSAALILSSTIPSLRTLSSRIDYLEPSAGSFVVSNIQTLGLNGQLAQCAEALRVVLDKVKQMERGEEEGKKDARMRLLRYIKSRESKETDQEELMALLLGAERDGEEDAESLQVCWCHIRSSRGNRRTDNFSGCRSSRTGGDGRSNVLELDSLDHWIEQGTSPSSTGFNILQYQLLRSGLV